MFFGKLWLRIRGELLSARDRISEERDLLKKPDELLSEAEKRLRAFLTDSTVQEENRTTALDPGTERDPKVAEEPKIGRDGQTAEHEPRATNPRTLG